MEETGVIAGFIKAVKGLTLGKAALVILVPGIAGFGVGKLIPSTESTSNTGWKALGGAAGGALVGAGIGSVVPGIGTGVGFVVGGVAGLIGGLLS